MEKIIISRWSASSQHNVKVATILYYMNARLIIKYYGECVYVYFHTAEPVVINKPESIR